MWSIHTHDCTRSLKLQTARSLEQEKAKYGENDVYIFKFRLYCC